MGTQTTAVKAFLDEELDSLLEVLEIRQDFRDEKCLCASCREVVTYDNIMMIFPLPDQTVGFLCSKMECRLTTTPNGHLQDRD